MRDEHFHSLFNRFIHLQKINKWAGNIFIISCLVLIISFFTIFGSLAGIVFIFLNVGLMFACILTITILSFTSIKAGNFEIDNYIKEKYNISELPMEPTLNISYDYNTGNIVHALKNLGFKKIRQTENSIIAKRKFWPLSLLKLSDLFLLLINRLGHQTIKISKKNNQLSITVSSLYSGIDYETLMEIVNEIYPNLSQDEINNLSKNEEVGGLKPVQTPGSRLKWRLIALVLLVAALSPKIYTQIKKTKIQKNVSSNIISEILNYEPGKTMQAGKIYKIFEIPSVEEQTPGDGGDIINNIFYTKCSSYYKQIMCGSFNLENKTVELFDYEKYKEKMMVEMNKFPDQKPVIEQISQNEKFEYLIGIFARENSANYVTRAGIVVDPDTGIEKDQNKNGFLFGKHIDYRTENYDYIINCDPVRNSYPMEVATQGMHCIVINKRNGVFLSGEKEKVIITGYNQPKGLTILEKSLIWQQYNSSSKKTEYFVYNIE